MKAKSLLINIFKKGELFMKRMMKMLRKMKKNNNEGEVIVNKYI